MESPRETLPKVILPFWIWDFSVIAWLGILCIPFTSIAIEPIGLIGQPHPTRHAFLSDEALLRAVPTHIQIVQPCTGEVIDEFGKRSPSSDVVFSPTAEHLAILNYSPDSETTTVHESGLQLRETEVVFLSLMSLIFSLKIRRKPGKPRPMATTFGH